jgi:hypothetical protein
MDAPYNYKNCQSLFGYAFHVHVRSSGTCQLCGCGGPNLTFDLWRQMTVEHIIGQKQGGHIKNIRIAVAQRFPELSAAEREALSAQIDAANTVTACSFCNSTTSQNTCASSMSQLILQSPGTPNEVAAKVIAAIRPVLEQKRAEVRWKLASVHQQFESRFLAALSASVTPAS